MRKYETWASVRNTSESVAVALHELSSDPSAWWLNGHGDASEAAIIRRARELETSRGEYAHDTLYLGDSKCGPNDSKFS